MKGEIVMEGVKSFVDKILNGEPVYKVLKEGIDGDYSQDASKEVDRLLDALVNLEKAFDHVADVVDNTNLDTESFLITSSDVYPFNNHKPFDEFCQDVRDWVNAVYEKAGFSDKR